MLVHENGGNPGADGFLGGGAVANHLLQGLAGQLEFDPHHQTAAPDLLDDLGVPGGDGLQLRLHVLTLAGRLVDQVVGEDILQ